MQILDRQIMMTAGGVRALQAAAVVAAMAVMAAMAAMTVLHGCAPSVDSYFVDPEARRDMLARCAKFEIEPRQDERCQMVASAEPIAVKEAVQGAFSV